jgi:hypothetical protein
MSAGRPPPKWLPRVLAVLVTRNGTRWLGKRRPPTVAKRPESQPQPADDGPNRRVFRYRPRLQARWETRNIAFRNEGSGSPKNHLPRRPLVQRTGEALGHFELSGRTS